MLTVQAKDLNDTIDRDVREGRRDGQSARLARTALAAFLKRLPANASLGDLEALVDSGEVVGSPKSYATYRSRVRALLRAQATHEAPTESVTPRRQVVLNPDGFTRIPFPLPSGIAAYLIAPTIRGPDDVAALADQLEVYAKLLRIQLARKGTPTPSEEDAM